MTEVSQRSRTAESAAAVVTEFFDRYRAHDVDGMTDLCSVNAGLSYVPVELWGKQRVVRGDGKRQLYVFEDPDCPYCKKFEEQLPKINNVTLHIFLYPFYYIEYGIAQIGALQVWRNARRDPRHRRWSRCRATFPAAVSR